MRALIPLLLLAGCSTTPKAPPAVEVRTQRIEVPVAVPCVDKSSIPTEPEKVASKLTGDARHDLDIITANALRLRAWGRALHAVVEACAK